MFTSIHTENLWSVENFRMIRCHREQREFSINRRAGILSDCLVGRHIFPSRVDDRYYLNFLRTHLSSLLEEVSFSTRLVVSAQRCSTEVRQWLSDKYSKRLIACGREALVSWPALSPNFNSIFCMGSFENHILCNYNQY